jgi:transcription termination/antitermination protein NusG
MKKWYIIHTLSGNEFKVKELLEDKINEQNLNDFFGKILIPIENIMEVKFGKKQTSKRKIFPGYILIEMDMNSQSWNLIKNTNQVFGFVGGKPGNPIPISENDINSILNKMKESSKNPKPKILFKQNEIIKIINGPFSGFNGTVEEINYDKNRLCISVLIFGRSTLIDLDFSQVEKI